MWERLDAVCPTGAFYHGHILDKHNKPVHDEAMLAIRRFSFTCPFLHRIHSTSDGALHPSNTKVLVPGPDGLPSAL